MSRFRVLVGMHFSDGPSGTNHCYRTGDIVVTDQNLLIMNAVGMSPKFEKLEDFPGGMDYTPTQPEDAGRILLDHPNQPPATLPPLVSKPPASLGPNPPEIRNKEDYFTALDKMTVPELISHAADEEIELKGATQKARILKILKAAVETDLD